MGLLDWFKSKTIRADLKGNATDGTTKYTCAAWNEAIQEFCIRELAIQCAINMIANAVSKCEFKTFKNGVEHKGELYYKWNVSPNANQNSSTFIHKLIFTLCSSNESLVVERANSLLVADSYERTHHAVAGDKFTEVVIEDLEINTYFRQKDVLLFRLNTIDVRSLLNALFLSYSKLISAAKKDYIWSSGRHGIMKIGALAHGSSGWQEEYNQIMQSHMKPFMTSDNGVLPVFNGMEYEELGGKNGRAQQTTRDIRALIDDIFEFTSKAFGIPVALLKGDVQGTGDAVNNFLTFCIDPICDQLEEEINRKTFTMEDYLSGNYIKIDTTKIRHFDMFSNATNVDKLISSGAYSVNDVRLAAGDTRIEEDWADRHIITKNYTGVEELLKMGAGP